MCRDKKAPIADAIGIALFCRQAHGHTAFLPLLLVTELRCMRGLAQAGLVTAEPTHSVREDGHIPANLALDLMGAAVRASRRLTMRGGGA